MKTAILHVLQSLRSCSINEPCHDWSLHHYPPSIAKSQPTHSAFPEVCAAGWKSLRLWLAVIQNTSTWKNKLAFTGRLKQSHHRVKYRCIIPSLAVKSKQIKDDVLTESLQVIRLKQAVMCSVWLETASETGPVVVVFLWEMDVFIINFCAHRELPQGLAVRKLLDWQPMFLFKHLEGNRWSRAQMWSKRAASEAREFRKIPQ